MKRASILLTALLMLTIPACDRGPSTPKVAPVTSINVLAWSEYIPQEVLAGYEKEMHLKVNIDVVDSNEAMQAKLFAGGAQYDVIQPSEYFTEALIKMNKLAAIEANDWPDMERILPEYTNQPFDPGNRFTVPYMSGTVGIVYNNEKIKDPIKGFKDVFKPEHAGRIVVLKDNREIVSWAMIVNGIPINDVTKENLEKVKPTLAQWVKLIKKYDSDSPKTDLLQGNVDIGIVWNGEAAIVIKDKRFTWVVPEEGTHRYIDSLAIPADAPHRRQAEEFIHYCLRPDVAKIIAEKWPYTCPNGEARKLLSPEAQNNPASYPKLDSPQTFRDIGKQAAEIDRMMTELQSGG